MSDWRCPRCGQPPAVDDPASRGAGAISRTDNLTMICSPCGTSEAMEDFILGRPTPRVEWPVRPSRNG